MGHYLGVGERAMVCQTFHAQRLKCSTTKQPLQGKGLLDKDDGSGNGLDTTVERQGEKTGDRRQKTEYRRQETGDRIQNTEYRRQKTEYRRQEIRREEEKETKF
jgi:Ni/Co efflux regulator RcnB